MVEEVVLVDINGNEVGTMEKMKVHQLGYLHRAFSIFLFNEAGDLLLQKRASGKYHSGGLWTNTCCSHQRMGETNLEAGARRLQEEMGFETPLEELFSFIYKAPFDNGLTEHELDHVLLGHHNAVPEINTEEVASWKWMDLDQVAKEIITMPDQYTVWFKIIFDRFYKHIKS